MSVSPALRKLYPPIRHRIERRAYEARLDVADSRRQEGVGSALDGLEWLAWSPRRDADKLLELNQSLCNMARQEGTLEADLARVTLDAVNHVPHSALVQGPYQAGLITGALCVPGPLSRVLAEAGLRSLSPKLDTQTHVALASHYLEAMARTPDPSSRNHVASAALTVRDKGLSPEAVRATLIAALEWSVDWHRTLSPQIALASAAASAPRIMSNTRSLWIQLRHPSLNPEYRIGAAVFHCTSVPGETTPNGGATASE